ncbi:unnamed protein product [Cercospora beticola]|nr:unnamed protein product [Cercospora beticola]
MKLSILLSTLAYASSAFAVFCCIENAGNENDLTCSGGMEPRCCSRNTYNTCNSERRGTFRTTWRRGNPGTIPCKGGGALTCVTNNI